ncbi:hypothetical protein V8C34DRAFT_294066 [Trichoderma compactum]
MSKTFHQASFPVTHNVERDNSFSVITPVITTTRNVRSIFFSAANTSAIHLLESLSYTTAAPPNLIRTKRRIGYQLEIPSLLSSNYDTSKPLWEVGAGPATGGEASSREPETLLCPPEDTLGTETARRSKKRQKSQDTFA